MLRVYHALMTDRRLQWALLWVNLLGSAYGFYWYRNQLASTPYWLWPLVPDSPGSTLLLCLWLGCLLTRRAATRGWVGLLGALAFAGNIKYGLWTATVLPQHAIWSGTWLPEAIYLSLSHLGMCLQAILFAWTYRLARWMAAVALAWLLVQDLADYLLFGTHPALPNEALRASAGLIALAYSLIAGLFLLAHAKEE